MMLSLATVVLAVHYEKPPCAADESLAQVSKYTVCSPACTKKDKCPTDAPSGVTATAECALSDPFGNNYCVLECTADSDCDTAHGAKCALVQPPKGICHYGKAIDAPQQAPLQLTPSYLTASYVEENVDVLWSAFVVEHNRAYATSEEATRRRRIFANSLRNLRRLAIFRLDRR
jgi:hypothetical protein